MLASTAFVLVSLFMIITVLALVIGDDVEPQAAPTPTELVADQPEDEGVPSDLDPTEEPNRPKSPSPYVTNSASLN